MSRDTNGSTQPRRWRSSADLIPLATLVVFFCAAFREALLGQRFILIGDPLKQLYPLRMMAWEMIREGSLPLWTPHILAGYPLFSMAMLGIGYPLTWGYLLLPGHWAEQSYVLAPYLLSPIFTYFFLRELGRSPIASMLGGLVFSYGGFLFSPIGLTGVHANSALWLPLVLLGVARARRAPFLSSLVIATAAYTLSVLAGSGQIFLYGGALSLAFGFFLALAPAVTTEVIPAHRWAAARWQPPLVAVGSIVLSAGLTAYQTLETWTAVTQSVRQAYPLERFSEGSFPPLFAWRSMLQPLGNFWDSSTFVPLLALGLSLVALVAAVRHPRRFAHVFFWAFVAGMAWFLILGKYSPLFDLYAQLPFVKQFRYPSRHTLEWTFSIAVLAAFGWDIIAGARKRGVAGTDESASPAGTALMTIIGSSALLGAAAIAIAWARYIAAADLNRITDINNAITQLDDGYLGWKGAFTLAVVLGLAAFSRISRRTLRRVLLATGVAFCCFVEPYLWMIGPIINRFSIATEMFGSFAETTRILRQELHAHERTFSLVHPYVVPSEPVRAVDAVNWTALAGLHDVNGYESLILERLIRALRGDAVDAEPFVFPDLLLINESSHVLDLLSVRYVTAYDKFFSGPVKVTQREDLSFSGGDLNLSMERGERLTLSAGANQADTLALVTTLALSGNVPDGATVACISLHGGGRVIERALRAGVHTAEWAHDRADVRQTVRHGRAPIFDSSPGDHEGSFQGHRYLGRLDLGERISVERVDMEMVVPEARLILWRATLYDSASRQSYPVPEPSPSRWETIHEKNRVTILRNLRAHPRAWLVGEIETLAGPEILRRIRGEDPAEFDPRTKAFVEVPAHHLPVLPRRPPRADSHVRIVRYRPSRIVLETSSPQPALLVVSEIDYPGWVATVDGVETPIHRTNYLLRGVFIPPGWHLVTMDYRPDGLRRGSAISLTTLLLIGAVVAVRHMRSFP